MDRWGLSGRISVVHTDAAQYAFEEGACDVASCIGASMIWDGFRPSIRRMKDAIPAGGRIIIGEPYYTQPDVPPELIEYEGKCHTEAELFEIAREESCEVGYVTHASGDDWDRYAGNWCRDVEQIISMPDSTTRGEHWQRLHRSQDIYIKHRRSFEGWAIYVLLPVER